VRKDSPPRAIGSDAVALAITRAIDDGATPGAAVIVGRGSDVLFEGCYGRLWPLGPTVSAVSIYDLSSLTKPLATLASLLKLVAAQKVSLATPLCDVLGDFDRGNADRRRARVTLLQLAAHASGLPARGRYFEKLREAERLGSETLYGREQGRTKVIALASAEPLVADPGTRIEYSDVGYILLGAAIERVANADLATVVSRELLDPLGLRDVGFADVRTRTIAGRQVDLSRVAPADVCPWRGSLVHGVVQDENAHAMGGIAGHAGLFGTARAVHRLAAEYVRAYLGESSILDPASVRQCWSGPGCVVAGSTWSVGWDTPTPGASSAGRLVSARAFGHLGFTGTSIWVDLERGVHVVLLTNRVHPSKENLLIREMRPRVHDAIFEMVDGE
jgi:CubicO group peptidase (beta-lactamase class C family)